MIWSLAPPIVIAIWVLNVQARDEMLVHGWIPEPSGRGTWSILWSCLATIFICIWSALHVDVPKYHGRWYLTFRKVGWMLWAAMAPEVILGMSAENFFGARALSKHLRTHGHRGWTLTHMHFAFAGGFWTRTPQREESKCDPVLLRTLIEKGDVDGPPISEEELTSRGKSDWIIKSFAILQILWFVVQTLFRAIQHYQTTALEIMTVALVFCSVFVYGFSFYQPQNVEYPVFLEISATARTTDGAASATDTTMPAIDKTKPNQNSDKSIGPEEGAEPASPIGRVLGSGMRSGVPSQYVPGWAAKTLPLVLFGLFACGFGALHCLAWNSPFPTSKERLAWRVCSATTTALSALLALSIFVLGSHDNSETMEIVIALAVIAVTLLYVIGRITIIVLAFMSLRALPADAFQTVTWNNYIPHFAA